MKPLAVFGTSSDAGKTTVVMALCRIFADLGIHVAPFKAQNVSNNSAVTQDGREIARAQCFQAEAARVPASHLFNPIMLKSHGNGGVQVIINGLVDSNQSIASYFDGIEPLQTPVSHAFSKLLQQYELVIAEGAGSPVELNLLSKDLSNTFLAKTFNTKNILVADIERGGVFASIYGTLALLDPQLKENLIGVIINKFRGDRRFFDEGEKIIQEQFGLPVLGVLPFQPINIDMEDSQSLQNYQQRLDHVKIRLAVIAYPGLSNYNDLDVLMADPEIHVQMVSSYQPLANFDGLLLPGSKTVFRDLQWLKSTGLFQAIRQFNKPIFGLCGGYQMLCASLQDPNAIEHNQAISETGLDFIDATVEYKNPKILRKDNYALFSYQQLTGYEIHCGRIEKYPLYYQSEQILATHVHGIFDNDQFRTDYFKSINPAYQGYQYESYREQQIQGFADMVAENVDIKAILQAVTNN
jgi:adenosylcobyric acid synthase